LNLHRNIIKHQDPRPRLELSTYLCYSRSCWWSNFIYYYWS